MAEKEAGKREGITRAEVGRAIGEFIARMARESESDEDFADDLSDFVVYLESKLKRAICLRQMRIFSHGKNCAREKLASLEKKEDKPLVELIAQSDSKNFSSLVLRADCVKNEDYEKLKEIFEEARKKLSKR